VRADQCIVYMYLAILLAAVWLARAPASVTVLLFFALGFIASLYYLAVHPDH